jgi:hypothetical protein
MLLHLTNSGNTVAPLHSANFVFRIKVVLVLPRSGSWQWQENSSAKLWGAECLLNPAPDKAKCYASTSTPILFAHGGFRPVPPQILPPRAVKRGEATKPATGEVS